MTFSDPPVDLFALNMDEACTVLTVSPSLIELDCETYDPQISLELVEPWTPNLAVDDTVRVVADGYIEDLVGWYIDWRIEHADTSFALAGREHIDTFASMGVGAIDLTVETGVCTPDCFDVVALEQAGLTFEFDGKQATLFDGGHAIVGNREVWVIDAWHISCEQRQQMARGHGSVVVSAVP